MSAEGGGGGSFDILAAAEWAGVGEEAVLLPPSDCRRLWRHFLSDSNFSVQQVRACCVPWAPLLPQISG